MVRGPTLCFVGKGKHHRAAESYVSGGKVPKSVGSSPPPEDPDVAAVITADPPSPPIGSGWTLAPGDLGGWGGWYGAVSVESSLALSAVVRCVSVIAGAVSRFPWREWDGLVEVPPSRLVERPAASMTRREWTWKVAATLALESTCYLLAVGGEDDEGLPWSLIPVPPQAITPTELADPWGMIPPTSYRIGDRDVSAEQLVILRRALWPGVPDHLASILRLARQAFGAALSADRYASRYWAAGGSPTTYISTAQELTKTQAADLGELWRERRSRGPDYPAVLGKGAEARPFGADPTMASAVDARRELVADVARFFGVPTRLANAPASDDETYANVESEGLDLLRYCLGDYTGPIEDAISGLLPPPRRMVQDPTGYTRGLQQDRYSAWSTATGGKPWMLPAEVREAEHLPPLDDAQLRELEPPPPPALVAAPPRPAPERDEELEPVARS